MRYLIAIVCAIVLFSPPAYADDKMDVRKQIIDGNPFVCFTTPDAEKLLQMDKDYPTLQLKLQKQDELISVKTQEIITLEAANGISQQQVTVLTDDNTRMQRQIDSDNKWYKSPYLWFTVGFVLGAAASVAIVVSVK